MKLSNRNLPTSIFVVLGFLLLLLIPFDVFIGFLNLSDFQTTHLADILKNLCIIIYALSFIYRYRYEKVSGLRNFFPRRWILLLIPLYFVLVGPLWYVYFGYELNTINALDVVMLLCAMLSVGFSEELVFRGFVLPHLIRGSEPNQPLIGPILLSSLLFGILHLLNLFNPDSHFASIIAQVVYATFFGVAFAIILLKTKSLLPLGFLHGIINFANSLDELPGAIEPSEMDNYVVQEAIFAVLIVLPFLLYTLRQLPSLSKEEILDYYVK